MMSSNDIPELDSIDFLKIIKSSEILFSCFIELIEQNDSKIVDTMHETIIALTRSERIIIVNAFTRLFNIKINIKATSHTDIIDYLKELIQ